MSESAEMKIRQDLYADIILLDESYRKIKTDLLAQEYNASVVVSTLKTFKDSLNRASSYVLTLFTLKGKQVNITWEHLFTHLDYALTIPAYPPLKHRDAVQTVLSITEAEFNQVLTYFRTLKQSLK
jgi:hypothetical protein